MVWTRGRKIAAGAVGAVLLLGLGVFIGQGTSNRAPTTPPPENPSLPIAGGERLTPQQRQQVEILSRGALLAVFFHEAGHMFISELKIPATGPQEDVADEFATFVLTDALKAAPEAEKEIYATIIYAGANFFRLAAQGRDANNIPWYDEHSPELRRYYNMVCLATGADPLRFIPLAVRDGVPETRLRRCADEYKTKHEAWDQLMAPHMVGFWRKLFGVHRLTLEIGPPGQAEWAAFEHAYRQGGFFQQILDHISTHVNLPANIPVVVRGCGFVNAFWSPDNRKITLCHDFFAFLTSLFARNALAQVAAKQPQTGGGGPGPRPDGGPPPLPAGTAPAPKPNGGGRPTPEPGTDMRAELVGTWNCQGAIEGYPIQEQTKLEASGAFRTQTTWAATGQTMTAWGKWSAQPGVLRYEIQGINPPTVVQSPVIVPYQMPQPGVVQLQNLTCRKVA